MSQDDSRKNFLLVSLIRVENERWSKLTEPVDMPLGHVLLEAGVVPSYVYFPTTAIVSFVHTLTNGASAEIAVVGREGMVGIALAMGDGSIPQRAVVQSAGQGFRISGKAFLQEMQQSSFSRQILLRYAQALTAQIAQTAVCNRHHSLDQQLCRWLLLSLDRLNESNVTMTQELIADMLGVRRESVTDAALKLQGAGVIRYARGRITVLDRGMMEKRSRECYDVVKKEYERLLPSSNDFL